MKPKLIYIPIDANEELPTVNSIYHHVLKNSKYRPIETALYYNGVFSTNNVTHWLKPVEQYIFTPDELKELLEKTFDECDKWKGYVTYSELEEKKQTYINSILEK